ncbi:MAG: cysteine methyltransferase, partial [Mesorhizobium sp.]
MEDTSQAIAGHAVFETVIGFIGIAWSEAGLTRLCLP